MKREDLAWLLNLANDMRKKNGAKPIDDLPESSTGEPKHCIIANAFNFGCSVMPSSAKYGGTISFLSEKDRNTYIKVMGNDKTLKSNISKNIAYLTPELNTIAKDFDRRLFPEYIKGRVY